MDTRIDQIKLTNFRCFPSLSLALDPSCTVLVAGNGGGKTAVLDALAGVLRWVVGGLLNAVTDDFPPRDVRVSDHGAARIEHYPASAEATGVFFGRQHTWQWERQDENGTTLSVQPMLSAPGATAEGGDTAWPVFAYYGTGRRWSTELSAPRRGLVRRVDAYVDCLQPASTFGALAQWFEAMSRESQRERADGVTSPHQPTARLLAVRRAVDAVLAQVGWSQLAWDFVREEIVARHPTQGQLPVSMLSDGVRGVLAMVADLAHRCARLNPHLGADAPAQTEGVVLVDEVDMHLHPAWQQTILGTLRAVFPRVQWVVTTHSPQVLSTVHARHIRVLPDDPVRDGVRTPMQQTRGVESAEVLATVMGVDPVPHVEEAQWLSDYRAKIADGEADTAEAQTLRARLDAHFGAQHPVMIDCDRLLRFQAFRLRRAQTGAPKEGA